jgi:hypothetical protein
LRGTGLLGGFVEQYSDDTNIILVNISVPVEIAMTVGMQLGNFAIHHCIAAGDTAKEPGAVIFQATRIQAELALRCICYGLIITEPLEVEFTAPRINKSDPYVASRCNSMK